MDVTLTTASKDCHGMLQGFTLSLVRYRELCSTVRQTTSDVDGEWPASIAA